MRIEIKDTEDADLRLWIPTGLIINRFTAMFIRPALRSHGIHISDAQAAAFVNALRESKHRFKDWVLVDICSADGSKVYIKL